MKDLKNILNKGKKLSDDERGSIKTEYGRIIETSVDKLVKDVNEKNGQQKPIEKKIKELEGEKSELEQKINAIKTGKTTALTTLDRIVKSLDKDWNKNNIHNLNEITKTTKEFIDFEKTYGIYQHQIKEYLIQIEKQNESLNKLDSQTETTALNYVGKHCLNGILSPLKKNILQKIEKSIGRAGLGEEN